MPKRFYSNFRNYESKENSKTIVDHFIPDSNKMTISVQAVEAEVNIIAELIYLKFFGTEKFSSIEMTHICLVLISGSHLLSTDDASIRVSLLYVISK
jgi:hypothetical protein